MARSIDYRAHLIGLSLLIAGAVLLNAGQGNSHDPASRSFNVAEVDVIKAKELLEAGATFIDVRSKEAFVNGHVIGALAIPLSELRSAIAAKLAIDHTKPIVIYCGDGIATGPEGTYVMNPAGFAAAVNLKGGIESWNSHGLPTAKGLS